MTLLVTVFMCYCIKNVVVDVNYFDTRHHFLRIVQVGDLSAIFRNFHDEQ